MEWSEDKRMAFYGDLRALFDTYEIEYAELDAGYVLGKFNLINALVIPQMTSRNDKKEVEEVLAHVKRTEKMRKIDEALDHGDEPTFNRLVGKVERCADCEEALRDHSWTKCVDCGTKICTKCSGDGGGKCVNCEFKEP